MGHNIFDLCPFWVLYHSLKSMSSKQIDFSNVLNDDQVYGYILNHYETLGKDWIAHQWTWMNAVYQPFGDHYKYLILISLIEKTLQLYDEVDITFTYDQYYSKSYLQIDKFSVTELCEKLNLPKETVRRKVLELEKLGVIKRRKKQVIIDRAAFPFIKPQNQINFTSKYIYLFAEKLNKKKVLSKKLDRKFITNIIKSNFTLCWRWYFNMQIPMIIGYNKYFKDTCAFHIWGTVVMNQAFNYSKNFKKSDTHIPIPENLSFNESFMKQSKENIGVSAMSISDMTGIPRASVVRKCKYLMKTGYLSLNDKKQYLLTGLNLSNLVSFQKEIFKFKAKFIRKILNLCII